MGKLSKILAKAETKKVAKPKVDKELLAVADSLTPEKDKKPYFIPDEAFPKAAQKKGKSSDKPEGYIFGRPTKYDSKYCEMLYKHMKLGFSLKAFAGQIGISVSTLDLWVKTHKDFSEAKELGEAASLLYWESLGMDLVKGSIKGSYVAWVFNMKNRHGWTDKHDISSSDGSMQPQVHIFLPENGRDK
jgi:hypothetical protein